MDIFLYMCELPTLNREVLKTPNNPKPANEIETIINKLPTKKSQGIERFTAGFYKTSEHSNTNTSQAS